MGVLKQLLHLKAIAVNLAKSKQAPLIKLTSRVIRNRFVSFSEISYLISTNSNSTGVSYCVLHLAKLWECFSVCSKQEVNL